MDNLGNMDPSESEFLSESETISVEPNFKLSKLYLIQGDFGPFVPNIPVKVPVWLAVNLKRWHKCRIIPPPWMNVQLLEAKKQEEMDSNFFTAMPSDYYMEISHLLTTHALDDIPYADKIRTLIKDIWDIRTAKLRTSIDAFVKGDETHARLDHLTLMEINTVRKVLTSSLDQLHFLRSNAASATASQLD